MHTSVFSVFVFSCLVYL